MSKLKIILITNMPTWHQVELFNEITKLNAFEFTVYYTRKMSAGRLWNIPKNLGHEHVFLPEIRFKDHWYINTNILKLLNDISLSNLVIVGQYASFTMQIAMFFCSIKRIPWVFWSEAICGVKYGDKPLFKSEILRKVSRLIALYPIRKWPVQCWAIGDFALSSFNKMLKHKRFEKFLYYFDSYHFRKDTSKNNKLFTFLWSGSLSKRKGFDIVVEAVKKLDNRYREKFKIIILGAGDLENLITEELNSYFSFKGFVQHENVHNYYHECNAYLFPSRYDGWGMALIEAMASGLAVVASSQSGAAVEVVENEKNGLLLYELTSEELAEKMSYLLDNREHATRMGILASESVKHLHVRCGADKFRKLIMSLDLTVN